MRVRDSAMFPGILRNLDFLVIAAPYQNKRSRTNRAIILLSIAVILICTLWPFDGGVREPIHVSWTSLILQWGKVLYLDMLLNNLLFLPFGFALAHYLQVEKGLASLPTAIGIVAVSFVFSYSIELIQLFFPARHASFVDVVSDTVGGLLGLICFQLKIKIIRSSRTR
jgi:VanZ like protein